MKDLCGTEQYFYNHGHDAETLVCTLPKQHKGDHWDEKADVYFEAEEED